MCALVDVSSAGGKLLSDTMEAPDKRWESPGSRGISAVARVCLQVHTNSVLAAHVWPWNSFGLGMEFVLHVCSKGRRWGEE